MKGGKPLPLLQNPYSWPGVQGDERGQHRPGKNISPKAPAGSPQNVAGCFSPPHQVSNQRLDAKGSALNPWPGMIIQRWARAGG